MPLSGITSVRPTVNTEARSVKCGASVSIANPVYQDVDGKHKPCDANASQLAAEAVGIALTTGVDDGYAFVARAGSVILVGATMVVGETYYVSPTAGAIIASSELTSGCYVTLLGVAASTTQLDLAIKATGIQRA